MTSSPICDYYPYDYRRVKRDDPAASIDVYRAAPDYPRGQAAADIERDCRHVAALAAIVPTCCFCGGPMNLGEDSRWLYGYDAEPVAARGERCCAACLATAVYAARKAVLDRKLEQAIKNGRFSPEWLESLVWDSGLAEILFKLERLEDTVHRRYAEAFPDHRLPLDWYGDLADLERLMEQAIKTGVPLTRESMMEAQGKVMPPPDVEV